MGFANKNPQKETASEIDIKGLITQQFGKIFVTFDTILKGKKSIENEIFLV